MKKVILGLILFVSIFMLSGCFTKKVITTDEFKSIAEKNGYTTTNVIEQYSNNPQIKEATVALNSKGFQVEFYVLDEVTAAIDMYNHNKDIFESQKGSVTSGSNVAMKNYDSYTLNSNGEYFELDRVDNTLFFAHVKKEFKDQVKDLTKQLGY